MNHPFSKIALLCKLTILLCVSYSATAEIISTDEPNSFNSIMRYAGVRASDYGPQNGTLAEKEWEHAATTMADQCDAKPSIIWIVGGVVWDEENDVAAKETYVDFPGESSDPFIQFNENDAHESYLNHFDSTGVSVWLQLEPSHGSVDTLIDLLLKQYSHHPSIRGIGIDVEWYKQSDTYEYGEPVSDSIATQWLSSIQSFNPQYQLFLKHWETEKMPQTVRENIIYINDGQNFGSLEEITGYFKEWGEFFSHSSVGFQFGYDSDNRWWKEYENASEYIAEHLLAEIPNTTELYWVDFTMHTQF